MPSTYSSSLRLELIATGEQDGTWGATTNTNLGTLLEEAIAGVVSVTHDDSANYTLTASNGSSDEARNMVLEVGGTLTAARNVVCPTQDKLYIVFNETSGGYAFTIKTSGGSGVSIPNGEGRIVYCDGTNVVSVTGSLAEKSNINNSDWSGTDLAVDNGGTGASTASGARSNLGLAIGSDVQAHGDVLDDLNTLGAVSSDGEILVGTGAGAFAWESGATARTSLGLAIGSDVQAYDANTAKLDTAQSWSDDQNFQDNVLQRPEIKDYGETVNAIGSIGGGAQDIDLESGNVVTATVDTSETTFTFSNPPSSGTCGSFTLVLTDGGSQTVNWPASVDWAGGSAPSLTSSGVDILTFFTTDGGTTWFGFTAGLDMS